MRWLAMLALAAGLCGCAEIDYGRWRRPWHREQAAAAHVLSHDVRRFLAARGAVWQVDQDPPVPDSSTARAALNDALDMLALRIEYAEANLAHAREPVDWRTGRPYVRQEIVIDANGQPRARRHEGDHLAVHRPSDPHADRDGFVYFPNVSVPREQAVRREAVADYNRVLEVLRQLAPETPGSPWPTEAP